MRARCAAPILLFACAAGTDPSPPRAEEAVAIHGRPGAFVLEIEDGRIAALTPTDSKPQRHLVPAFIDAHVHLTYDREVVHGLAPEDHQRDDALLDGGIAAVVDLAAPMRALPRDNRGLRVVASGPMLTAVDGYPTNGWGHDGYGLFVRTADEAPGAVDRLHDAGARLVKIPFAGRPYLDEATLRAIVERAHERKMLVFAHALSDAEARYAGMLGVDVLAHTPVEPLDDETVEVWKDKAVVSTLGAFGGTTNAVDNLRRLAAAGAIVLYGTDLGNRRTDGIDAAELGLLADAGLDTDAIIDAATRRPAELFDLPLGRLEVGAPASFLVFDEAPSTAELGRPTEVWIDGVRR